MANFSDLGRLLLIAGGAIVLLGLVLLLVGRVPSYIVSEEYPAANGLAGDGLWAPYRQ